MITNVHVQKPKVLCIAGPTAIGKTQLAMRLKDRAGVKLISVDSALVYRGMDIGSAKPSAAELRHYPHELINIRDHWDTYTAADFVRDARAKIVEAVSDKLTPVLVGGTMMYFKALIDGLSPLPPADQAFRTALEVRAAKSGWPQIHRELAAKDPLTAAKIHPNHSQRIERALEIIHLTGKPVGELRDRKEGLGNGYSFIVSALVPVDRLSLHARINERFVRMLEAGFVDEVAQLRKLPHHRDDLPSMRAVGYRQCLGYLNNETTKDEFVDKGQAATRQLCKRQLTWLRNWKNMNRHPVSFSSSNPYGTPVELDQITACLLKFCEKSS